MMELTVAVVAVAVEMEGQTREGAALCISVRDTGSGIPLDKQSRIFERFMQADSSHTRRHGGAGLGLAISKGLCDLMGAEISFVSRPGEGSAFTVRPRLALRSVEAAVA